MERDKNSKLTLIQWHFYLKVAATSNKYEKKNNNDEWNEKKTQ